MKTLGLRSTSMDVLIIQQAVCFVVVRCRHAAFGKKCLYTKDNAYFRSDDQQLRGDLYFHGVKKNMKHLDLL